MTDDPRPPASALQREVEPPRTAAALWLPLMALVAAAMLTIASGIAVMARRPCRMRAAPAPEILRVDAARRMADDVARLEAELDTLARKLEIRGQPEIHERPLDSQCRGPVYRAAPDGGGEQYEQCARPLYTRTAAYRRAR